MESRRLDVLSYVHDVPGLMRSKSEVCFERPGAHSDQKRLSHRQKHADLCRARQEASDWLPRQHATRLVFPGRRRRRVVKCDRLAEVRQHVNINYAAWKEFGGRVYL